jgi:hypothetical protein
MRNVKNTRGTEHDILRVSTQTTKNCYETDTCHHGNTLSGELYFRYRTS